MNFRAFRVRSKTVNAEARSVSAMISTETPVPEWDWQRGEVVPRILIAEGAILPKSRQIPLLDAHRRGSVESQLGSIRNLSRESNGISGEPTFSSAAEDAFTKVREGHVTDVSAGFEVLKENYVPAGETRTFFGKQYSGPVNVATKWRLHEGSMVPIGADEQAKMRGFRIAGGKLIPETPAATVAEVTKEEFRMNPELRKLCVERGMDVALNDVDAQAWLVANAATAFAPKPSERKADIVTPTTAIENKSEPITAEVIAREVTKAMELREKAQRDQRDAFERDVTATLEIGFGESVPAELKVRCLNTGTIDKAREEIRAYKKKQQDESPIGGGFSAIEAGPAQRDKHREVLQTSLLVRAYDLRGYGNADKKMPVEKRVTGWEQFRNAPLIELARECLIADGYSYREVAGLSRQSIAIAAMGWPHKVGLRASGYAYHVTGSLAYITLDAINKNLTDGYTEAPSTWRGPMRQASSVPDFKQKHVIKMGAVGNLPIWQDNSKPQQAAIANEKESYGVEARAETLSFSWQLYVNDDVDALSRGPGLLGSAAARTVNAVAWAQVTGSPTLSDGQALFLATATGNRKRSNLTTGANAPSNITLQTLTNKMMQMRGLNTPEGNESQDILNIQPVYLPHPSALRTTVLQLVKSMADPAASGNSGVYNPSQGLIPVCEPLLDANSTTAYYLFASPSQVDTIEVTFLQGQETPVVNDYVDESTWSRNITVVQSFAAKAIDHRGVQRHDGA